MNLDKVIFFEIPADNPQRAREFYQMAFGWKMNEIPQMHYTQMGTVEADKMGVRGIPKEPGAINGGMVERRDPVNNPVIYIRALTTLTKPRRKFGRTVAKSSSLNHRLATLVLPRTSGTRKAT